MISQLFILSQRGDVIISREYRANVPKNAAEIFFRKVQFWNGGVGEEAPPVFCVDHTHYLHLKGLGLHFVATTRANVSPAAVLELLGRLARVIKDYCGVLTEDALRKNVILVYELLDEMVDYGVVQSTSTEELKAYVFNEPAPTPPGGLGGPASALVGPLGPLFAPAAAPGRAPPGAVQKSVLASAGDAGPKEEIFVDVVEKLNVTFNAAGYVLSSEVDGAIVVKSFLTGSPEIRLALNESLTVARTGHAGEGVYSDSGGAGGAVVLDDCNFHSAVRAADFESSRLLALSPPGGEFTLMNYRTTHALAPPFRLHCAVDDASSPYALGVTLTLRADFDAAHAAVSVALRLPVPKFAAGVSCTLHPGAAAAGQAAEYSEADKALTWTFRKLPGGSEHVLVAKVALARDAAPDRRPGGARKEFGPATLSFTIPMLSSSRLQVRYLQILKNDREYTPARWVRYITCSASYVFRI